MSNGIKDADQRDVPTKHRSIVYETNCKNDCGLLSVAIKMNPNADGGRNDHWIRCKQCGDINRAFDHD